MFSLYFGAPSFLVPTDQQKLEEIQRQNSLSNILANALREEISSGLEH